MEIEWCWVGPEVDPSRELVLMALDTHRVIDQLRQASMEAEIWNAGEGHQPEMTPAQFMANTVHPHFDKVMDRLGDLRTGTQAVSLSLAAERLERAFWKHHMPPDFFGEELQGVYRDTWFATGHLVHASGVRLEGLQPTDKATLTSAAACVLLDPTVDRVFGSMKPDPERATRILTQMLKDRERRDSVRDR